MVTILVNLLFFSVMPVILLVVLFVPVVFVILVPVIASRVTRTEYRARLRREVFLMKFK